jgi:hypothetical protein
MSWIKYEAEGDDYVPMEQWGHDHWSTLAYLETCAVDDRGIISNAHMRCNSRLHRAFVYITGLGTVIEGAQYPTRLKDNKALENHDDWSCLEDMVKAGLLTAEYQVRYSRIFGNSVARVHLTPLGIDLAAQLRTHKASGASFTTFVPKLLQAKEQQ